MKTVMYLTVHKLGPYQPVEGEPAELWQMDPPSLTTVLDQGYANSSACLTLGVWTHRHGCWQIRIEGPAGFEVVEE
jgi:hypothetical protein